MAEQRDKGQLPTLVGLCPGPCMGEFYMPLEPGEDHGCPMCDRKLVLYKRTTLAASMRTTSSKDVTE